MGSRRNPRILSALLLLALGCGGEPGATPDAGPAASPDASLAQGDRPELPEGEILFASSRKIDLTGDGRPDSVALTARGTLPDSVTAVMRFFVAERVAHTESWSSSYELTDRDSVRADPRLTRSFVIDRFTTALQSVALEPVDTASIRMFSDPAVLDSVRPRPASQVTFSYGYESTVALGYDESRGRFVMLWACC